MKKVIAMLLAVLMLAVVFTGCGKKDLADWEYIKDKKEIVVGMTLYEPMNYYDENGELIGFDTEFTLALCEKLGVEAKFQEIEWEQKETELKSKAIDVIWNGLTVTEDRKENMAFSKSYLVNKQVVVINKANADKFATLADMAGATTAAEKGSAGETAITASAELAQGEFVGVSAQKDVLMELKAGTIEVGVLDYTLATAMVNDDTDYSDLMVVEGIELTNEEYAIGLRLEDVEFMEKVNEAIDELAAEGVLAEIAEKYDVADILAF